MVKITSPINVNIRLDAVGFTRLDRRNLDVDVMVSESGLSIYLSPAAPLSYVTFLYLLRYYFSLMHLRPCVLVLQVVDVN